MNRRDGRRARIARGLVVALAIALGTAGAAGAAVEVAGLRVLVDIDAATTTVEVGDAAPYPAETVEGLASYVLLAPGLHDVSLVRASADADGAGVRVVTIEVDLTAGAYHTLVVTYPAVVSSDAPAASTQRVESVLLHDDLTTLPRAGHARLHVVHAVTLAGAFDIEVRRAEGETVAEEPAADGADEDAPPIGGTLRPLESTGPHDLPAGIYDVRVGRGSEALDDRAPLRYDLRAGVTYTLYLMRFTDEGARGRLAVDASAVPIAPRPDGE